MELVIAENNSEPENNTENNVDIVESINKALENPQVRGMVGAILSNNGIDPNQMGIEVPENESQNNATKQMDNQNTEVESTESQNTQSNNSKEINAEVVKNMLSEIAEQSPAGENTTLGMVIQHVESNPEQINKALEAQGLK